MSHLGHLATHLATRIVTLIVSPSAHLEAIPIVSRSAHLGATPIGSLLDQVATRGKGETAAVLRTIVEETGAPGIVAQGTVDDLEKIDGTTAMTAAAVATSAGVRVILGATTGKSDLVARTTILPLNCMSLQHPYFHR